MKNSPREFRYRYDLDGLRGIAIALVVIYHVFVGRVSGGVDVFLLLSGYFFLGSQLRYMDKPNASFNPWWPIWRTLRRLIPALVLTVGVTYLLVRWLAPQLMRTELTQQITASLLYFQNWELARQNADYAAAAADTSPLQHLWSMAVQGQFYLLSIAFAFALGGIVKLISRRASLATQQRVSVRGIAGPLLIVATVASFVYASRYGLYAPASNYYDTWARAWELTLGGVLAIYGHRWSVPQRYSNFFTGLGLFALTVTGLLIADSTAFPGPLSLLPLGGAVLIIVGGGGSFSKAMASGPARWLGDIAYSLYLWHWPLLIVFTAALNRRTPPWWLGVLIVVASLGLAHLTHRFVEKPLRQSRKRPARDDMPAHRAVTSLQTPPGRRRAAGAVVVAAATVALLAIQPTWMRAVSAREGETLNPQLYPGAMALFGAEVPDGVPVQPDPILAGGIMPPTAVAHCFVAREADADHYNTETVDGRPCIFGDVDADFTVYVVGGSHAEQWVSGLDKLGRDMGFKLVPYLRQDCPIEAGENLSVTPDCAAWGEGVIDKIVDGEQGKADLVISNTTRPSGRFGTGPDAVPAGYVGFWDILAEHDIPFLGLRDNPWGFDEDGLGREFDECYVTTEDAIGCGMPRAEVYGPVDPGAEVLSQYDNMIAIDTSDWFCDAEHCPVIIGNTMVYRDMHHITNAFADSTMPLLRDYIQPFMDGVPQRQAAPAGDATDAAEGSEAPATGTFIPQPRPDAVPRGVAPVPYPAYGYGQAV